MAIQAIYSLAPATLEYAYQPSIPPPEDIADYHATQAIRAAIINVYVAMGRQAASARYLAVKTRLFLAQPDQAAQRRRTRTGKKTAARR